MRKTLCAATAAALVLALASPAFAKTGIEEATIEGEGLATPIKFDMKDPGDRSRLELFVAQSGVQDAMYRFDAGYRVKTPPAAASELGPRYEVTVRTFTHNNKGESTITMHLYPFTSEGTWFYMPPGQETIEGPVRSGWHQGPNVLAENLISWGIPDPNAPIAAPESVSSPSDFPILGVTALLAGLVLLGTASTVIVRRRMTGTARTT